MRKLSTADRQSSSIAWDYLEELVRIKVREFIQSLLEEEITGLLGRKKLERRRALDSVPACRNGHSMGRKLTLGCGTITVHRPRVRGLEERFESWVLPLFATRSKEVNQLIPQLYLHGLAQGDFDLALRGLLGEEAPISASTVARLKEQWQAEWEEWRKRNLAELELGYLSVDGVYVKAGLEMEKAALLVVIGGLSDGNKVILAVEPSCRESTESWSGVSRDLKCCGINCPRLVIGDGHLGMWSTLSNVHPDGSEQRCWNHNVLNVLDKLPKKAQGLAKRRLQGIVYSKTVKEAEDRRDSFVSCCKGGGYHEAAETLQRDRERMVTFYPLPEEHSKHLRTTNPVESPFAALRLRTDGAKRYRKAASATAVIWKMLSLAQQSFRKLDAPEKMTEVFLGIDSPGYT